MSVRHVIIADDLSGAAEISGVASKKGYRSTLTTRLGGFSGEPILSIDTDSRSDAAASAAHKIRVISSNLRQTGFPLLFKKTDSVLRGNVHSEIDALLQDSPYTRCVLIPANPSKRRTIVDGHYFVEGVPLEQTAFARDPEYPRKTSDVAELVGGKVVLVDPEDVWPEQGIIIPRNLTVDDLSRWVRRIDDRTLPAGGADFFDAFLPAPMDPKSVQLSEQLTPCRQLFVCGSLAAWESREADCITHGVPLVPMPTDLFEGRSKNELDDLREWQDTVVQTLKQDDCLVGICRRMPPQKRSPRDLQRLLAHAVASIAMQVGGLRLLLEGGATAAAVMKELDYTDLQVDQVLPEGLVEFLPKRSSLHRPADERPLRLIIKPGSYTWPEIVWKDATGVAGNLT
ncbi:four-carbon acid sugar kinase family protein [Stratiformator vulcanicus]|uniref:Four-carbon acid sugar kinase N-terminal domain-containing protein n=1 Tax=Stratiformator vulcanicus TaxID=2527980 RepID=A0A517R1E7_9PLAN|nr:four-carbon acid sugar kinase family protein [Stratiformator vulcanicus]QDT37707.1 hypothetical protein Pan189_20890 [Stratiformator vulcanicus]